MLDIKLGGIAAALARRFAGLPLLLRCRTHPERRFRA